MKKTYKLYITLLIPLLAVLLVSCCDCNKKKEKLTIPITGKMTWDEWQKSAGWKDYSAKDYSPDAELVTQLKVLLKDKKDVTFIIFSGNWCSDSEGGVPVIYKLLTLAGYDISKVELYGVDRDKKEPTGASTNNNIQKVPTIVIQKNNVEIGRIVESPIISWEEDIITILEEVQNE